jgi:hypothetical protein
MCAVTSRRLLETHPWKQRRQGNGLPHRAPDFTHHAAGHRLRMDATQRRCAGGALAKPAWDDGTKHFVMSPLKVTQRLAPMVPWPRLHLIRFLGVLASSFIDDTDLRYGGPTEEYGGHRAVGACSHQVGLRALPAGSIPPIDCRNGLWTAQQAAANLASRTCATCGAARMGAAVARVGADVTWAPALRETSPGQSWCNPRLLP